MFSAQALLIVALLLLNAFFVVAEFALVRVRATRLEELVQRQDWRARIAKYAQERIDAYLNTVQVGITLASIGLGWVAEPWAAKQLQPLLSALGITSPRTIHLTAFLVGYLTITFLHVVLGEMVPKSIAIRRTEPAALWTAPVLNLFHRLLFPLTWLMTGCASLVLRLLRIPPASPEEAYSEQELRLLLAASRRSGALKDIEAELMEHVFSLGDKRAKDIMVPRVDMVYLSTTWSLEENLRVAEQYGYTRFPLCEGDPDKVIGIIHVKDLYRARQHGIDTLKHIARDCLIVPESKSLDELLREFQQQKMHMAIVVDEYGGTSGLVTLEDVIEEIVGEIYDEFEPVQPRIQPLGNGRYLVEANVELEALAEQLGVTLPEEDGAFETVAGYVMGKIESVPRVGDRVSFGNYEMQVAEMRGRRVHRVCVYPLNDAESRASERSVQR
ncbi:MAG: hemolysin family protein [Armatimonadota bacterium]|nr:hemolysin family protein [Armatimonadota bacterium]MDW8103367.1 hemolysin family protein [Armatimonadota bacterium]